ncbi:MAG TPA: class I SAM-dependent methyltransferase [Solirubrobacter sp.]
MSDPETTDPAVLPQLAAHGWTVERVARRSGRLWVAGGADAAVDYPATGHELLAGIEDESAWYLERNRLVSEALAGDGLPSSLLEVGAGNGVVAAHLRRLGVDAVAVEPGRGAAEFAAQRGVPTICGLLEDLELPAGTIEAAGVFDVLEHLEDPGPLLAELHRILIGGGRLAVTVPALPALWSHADEVAGHHRRYRRETLTRSLADVGFEVRRCNYAFGTLVPPVALARTLPHRLGRQRSDADESEAATRQVAGYGDLGRHVARAAFAAERAVRRRVDVPFGTSLVAVFVR